MSDFARNLTLQTITKNLTSNPGLTKKYFVILSDQLVFVSKSTIKDKFLEESSKYNAISLFPKYLHFPPDDKENEHSVLYIGPIEFGKVSITATFFYYTPQEINDLSFLKPETEPDFDQIIKSWVMAGDLSKEYLKHIIKKFHVCDPKDTTYEKRAYWTIYNELNYYYQKFLLRQSLGIPQRFNFVIAHFVNCYILGRWFVLKTQEEKLSNDPKPVMPSDLDNLYMRPGKYEDITSLKSEVLRIIKVIGKKQNRQLENHIKWSPYGLNYKEIAKHYEGIKTKYQSTKK